MKTLIVFLMMAGTCGATDWGFGPPPEVQSEFGMGLFVPNAEIMADTICVDGVCYETGTTVTTWAPVANGVVFEAPQDGAVVPMDAPIMAYEVQQARIFAVNRNGAMQEVCQNCGKFKRVNAFGEPVSGYGLSGQRDKPILWWLRPAWKRANGF